MRLTDLRDVRLFQTLIERGSRDNCLLSQELAGALVSAASDAGPLLEYVKSSFPAYPSHGIDHSIRVLIRIGQILKDEALRDLSSMEIFLLIFSTLLHDIGMASSDIDKLNPVDIRNTHHERSADFAQEFLTKHLPSQSSRRLAKITGFIVRAHGLDWDEMSADHFFLHSETVGVSVVRPKILAILLRIGDLLDLDSDRVSNLCLSFFSELIEKNSSTAHHRRHQMIDSFECAPNRIRVKVECEDIEQFKIWAQWLRYLERDIERANTYVFRDRLSVFQLPAPDTSVLPTAGAEFELWNLRFEIDDSGTLWDVLRRSVYTGRFDHLRELVSNSIDACIRRKFETRDAEINSRLARYWSAPNYHALVLVLLDRKNSQIVVSDNGIGMSKSELQSYLFKVAGRGRSKNEEQRGFSVPTIGSFGIGFISVLTRASAINLTTRRFGDKNSESYTVEIDSNLRDASVRRTSQAQPGTTIILSLNESENNLSNAGDFLGTTFCFPTVDIALVDCDEIRRAQSRWAKYFNGFALLETEHWAERLETAPNYSSAILQEVESFINNVHLAEEAYEERRQSVNKSIDLSNERKKENRQPPRTKVQRRRSFQAQRCRILIQKEAPPNLDQSPVLVQVAYDGRPWRIQSLEHQAGPKNSINRGPGILIIPVMFDDHENGIEWRSLHSFPIGDRRIAKFVLFDIFLGVDPSFKIPALPLNSPDEAEEYLFDLLTEQGIEATEDKIQKMLSTAKSLQARKQDIVLEKELDLRESYLSKNPVKRQDLSFLGDLSRKDALYLNKVRSWYEPRNQGVCQDGIRVSVNIGQLAPIGVTTGLANLSATSRFRLNVSRNALDEVPETLRRWRKSSGALILNEIARTVQTVLESNDISHSWDELWTGELTRNLILKLDDWRSAEQKTGSVGK